MTRSTNNEISNLNLLRLHIAFSFLGPNVLITLFPNAQFIFFP